uniref:Uncharacterized protein n=1 Tax=Molossus molossus TaxID=27622 RepID=A0A7J8C8N8_MOLMO|nr:hypothetical protein HJG59_009914 [Molossus molossus]
MNIHHIALDTPIGFNIQSSSTSTFSYGIENHPISASNFTWCSPCVCLCVQISPLHKETKHIGLVPTLS